MISDTISSSYTVKRFGEQGETMLTLAGDKYEQVMTSASAEVLSAVGSDKHWWESLPHRAYLADEYGQPRIQLSRSIVLLMSSPGDL